MEGRLYTLQNEINRRQCQVYKDQELLNTEGRQWFRREQVFNCEVQKKEEKRPEGKQKSNLKRRSFLWLFRYKLAHWEGTEVY